MFSATPVDFALSARFFARGPTGARRAPGLPCALSFEEGEKKHRARTHWRRENGFLRSRLFDKEICWSRVGAAFESRTPYTSPIGRGRIASTDAILVRGYVYRESSGPSPGSLRDPTSPDWKEVHTAATH